MGTLRMYPPAIGSLRWLFAATTAALVLVLAIVAAVVLDRWSPGPAPAPAPLLVRTDPPLAIREFWRVEPELAEGAIPVAEIVEGVRHSFRESTVRSTRYTAQAKEDGRFHFGPAGGEEPGLTFGADDGETWQIAGNRARKRRADGWIEHWRAGENGVAVAWVLELPPERAGEPVRLRTPLAGLPLAQRDSAGFHFSGPEREASIRVSHAVLADSGGNRWPLEDKVVDGALEIEIPPHFLAQAEFPIAVDPVVSWEAIAPKPEAVPLARYQGEPAVAWNGTLYLVAWTDGRFASDLDIFATRYSPTEGVLDPGGIPLTRAAGDQRNPRVASSGSSFLVVWEDTRNGKTEHDIFANVVTAEGTVATRPGFPIAQTAAAESSPDAAGGPDGFLAVWESDGRIVSRRLTVDGQPAGELIEVSSGPGIHTQPAVTAGGTDDLVAWNHLDPGGQRSIRGRLIERESGAASPLLEIGSLRAPFGQPERASRLRPAVAAGAAGFAVAWPNGYEFSVIQPDCVGCPPAYVGPVAVSARRLSPNGEFLDSEPMMVRGPSGFPWPGPFFSNTATVGEVDIASDSFTTGFTVVWEEPRIQDGAAFRSKINSSGQLSHPPSETTLGGETLTPDSPRAGSPALAAAAFETLLLWEDGSIAQERYSGLGSEVQVTARSIDRARLEPFPSANDSPVAVAPYPAQPMTPPAIAARNGGEFLIVWGEPGLLLEEDATGPAIYGVLYRRPEGPPHFSPGAIERQPFLLARPDSAPEAVAAAADPEGYLVAWTELTEDRKRILKVTATDPRGTIRWWNQIVGSAPAEALRHAVPRLSLAAAAGGAVAVWEIAQPGSGGALQREVTAGVITESNPGSGRALGRFRTVAPLGLTPRSRFGPDVAASGNVFLLAWSEELAEAVQSIHGGRIDLRQVSGGTWVFPLEDRFSLTGSGGGSLSPALAGDSHGWLIAYEDRTRSPEQRDVSSRYLRFEETTPGPPFAIAAADHAEFAPAAASVPDEGFLVTWLDDRALPPDGIGWAGGFREAVFGSQVTAGGAVLHPGGFLIDPANAGTSRSRPDLAAAAGEFLIAYQAPAELNREESIRFRRIIPDRLPALIRIDRRPDGSVRLIISNPTAVPFRIEVSADLRNWQALEADTTVEVADPDAAGQASRYYRLVVTGAP